MVKMPTKEFKKSVQSNQEVSSYTHNFYKYPARFSPVFARHAIKEFTEENDLVIDPFMGAGTSLIESALLNRQAVGSDINSLAHFLADVKTTIYRDKELKKIEDWLSQTIKNKTCHQEADELKGWKEKGYLRHLFREDTWPIRKIIHLILSEVVNLKSKVQQNFARCILLKTGQWALDSRQNIPSVDKFRARLLSHFSEMKEQAIKFREALDEGGESLEEIECLNLSAEKLVNHTTIQETESPKLILTSPPYPGVHVLYHRWQIKGRKETPAPYWIANRKDGQGESYYTLGYRRQPGLKDYFQNIENIYKSLSTIADSETTFVQLVGFSDKDWQLKKFLEVLEGVNLKEMKYENLSESDDGRLWRNVPNRKWYTSQKENISSSNEVVLFHKVK